MAKLQTTHSFDVLVVGSGIAGTTAALSAASKGASVGIISYGTIFSGSSFYPGTWGLGLIGPESSADESDMIASILDVGSGVADPTMVTSFVRGIAGAIDQLEAWGMRLKYPDHATQKEFIPCFDHKHRLWRGLERSSFEPVIDGQLTRHKVTRLPRRELLDIIVSSNTFYGTNPRLEDNPDPVKGTPLAHNAVSGVVVYNQESGELEHLSCKACILASGGFGALFRHRLSGADVLGSAHALALRCGCSLINLEFMQIMPGLIHPKSGIVFNEKTFRFAKLYDAQGQNILRSTSRERELLEMRSGYGPFTSRLASRNIDLALAKEAPQGLEVRYHFGNQPLPEFVETYFDWLATTYGTSADSTLRIVPYAHAANGGIKIAPDGSTGVSGLYACGEATGGMHGADRIGGLSSANGLVFGLRAGASAAAFTSCSLQQTHQGYFSWSSAGMAASAVAKLRRTLQETMSEHCMIVRCNTGLSLASNTVEKLLEYAYEQEKPTDNPRHIQGAVRILAQLTLAQALLYTAQWRTESRGAHYRSDFPCSNTAFARPSIVRQDAEGGLILNQMP